MTMVVQMVISSTTSDDTNDLYCFRVGMALKELEMIQEERVVELTKNHNTTMQRMLSSAQQSLRRRHEKQLQTMEMEFKRRLATQLEAEKSQIMSETQTQKQQLEKQFEEMEKKEKEKMNADVCMHLIL